MALIRLEGCPGCWVFAVRRDNFVCFVVLPLISQIFWNIWNNSFFRKLFFFFFFFFFFALFLKSQTQYEPRQANLCLRAFRHDKFQLRMPSHSEGPGIWLSVWRFLLTHCLYERAAEVLARLRGCAGSPEPSLLAEAISTKFAWRGPYDIKNINYFFFYYQFRQWKSLWNVRSFACLFDTQIIRHSVDLSLIFTYYQRVVCASGN